MLVIYLVNYLSFMFLKREVVRRLLFASYFELNERSCKFEQHHPVVHTQKNKCLRSDHPTWDHIAVLRHHEKV